MDKATAMNLPASGEDGSPGPVAAARSVGVRRRPLFGLLLALLLAPPLFLGVRASRLLDWPYDIDLFRDIAQAETIAQGRPLDDPFYRGESLWYTPLAPALVALASKVIPLPMPVLYTRLGAWLNLLAPLTFALLVRRLFGPVAAIVATFDFLFVRNPADPSWSSGTYSPWLYAANLAQSVFYLAVWAYARVVEAPTPRRFALFGALAGLTFLGHAGAGVTLGGTVLLHVLLHVPRLAAVDRRRWLLGLLLVTGAAVAVASPLLASIVGRYHLHVQNPAPMRWNWALAQNLGGIFRQLKWETAVSAVVIGVWAIAGWKGRARPESGVAAAWLGGGIAFLIYGFYAAGLRLPEIVPRHHALLYIKAAESALVGFACSELVRATLAKLIRDSLVPFAALATVLAGILLVLPEYSRRGSFEPQRHSVPRWTTRPYREEVYQWLRKNATLDDVTLANDEMALTVVGPAGVKVVALEPFFSNPFVALEPRRRARDQMFAALERGDPASFEALAREYQVTLVYRSRLDGDWFDDEALPILERTFTSQKSRIYRVRQHPAARD
jgi:hypothetical protein